VLAPTEGDSSDLGAGWTVGEYWHYR